MNTIAALILTYNEENHIARCICSLENVCEEVWVLDSYSTDRTCEIAESMGAKVCQHAFENYSKQFNWGLQNLPVAADWIWRIDADEFLEGNIGQAVRDELAHCADNVNGVYVRKRIDFMGRPLLHGGWYPTYHLKVFRKGHGACENRWMDEHVRLFDGTAIAVDAGNQVDANRKDLTWWTEKANSYATREMIDMLLAEYALDARKEEVVPKFWGTEEQRKRWLKMRYMKWPLFVRPVANFAYRYFFRLGFLDGKEGFLWHFLQGWWYRTLADAKVYELKKRFGFDDEKIKAYLRENYLK